MRKLIFLVLFSVLSASGAGAQELRQSDRIARPPQDGDIVPAPLAPVAPGLPGVSKTIPEPLLDLAVRRLEENWNKPEFAAVLSPAFYDGERLNDTLLRAVPRDARLEIIGVTGARLLSDEIVGDMRESQVRVTLNTLITYNDPEAGYQRLRGTVEVVMTIKETVPS